MTATPDEPPTPAKNGQKSLDHVETWIFDLDNTLYRVTADSLKEIDRRIGGFIMEALGVDADEAYRLQKFYFAEYGLTLRGLMVNHGLDPARYFAHMGPADLSDVPPDPALAAAIGGIEGRKIIYTNSWSDHAEAMLAHLGIADHFEVVHDIIEADYMPKPSHESFAALCTRHRIEARAAVMIDDIQRNLAPAAAAGATTVWIKTSADWVRDQHPADHVHHVVEDLAAWLEQVVMSRGDDRDK